MRTRTGMTKGASQPVGSCRSLTFTLQGSTIKTDGIPSSRRPVLTDRERHESRSGRHPPSQQLGAAKKVEID